MHLLPHTMQTILDEQPASADSVTAQAVSRLEQRFGMTAAMSLNARLLAEALNAALSDPHTRSLLQAPGTAGAV
ncbi:MULTISPECIES: hypothetical protein [unclassified Devosia]|uniref:hypothetical protein n=1 Tax=unclassified Devosia TaxID=196773 RepID=UPI000FDCD982|nr:MULTISPECIES: hypothetical protein [unclassified Devosia]